MIAADKNERNNTTNTINGQLELNLLPRRRLVYNAPMRRSNATPPAIELRAEPASLTDRAYDEIRSRLADGSLGNGDRLAAERDLSAELGVSRVTLRRALARLRTEGTIRSVRGAGTFITSPVLAEAPNNLLSFSRLSQSRGLTPGSQVIGVDQHPASIEEGEQCGIAPGAPVIVIERIRLLDGLPVAISRSTVPSTCAPSALEADWSTASLYDELAAAGNPPVRADYAIEARAADHTVAEQLNMTFGHPVLLTASTSYAASGRIVEVTLMTYRGDRYRFRGTLHA